MSEAANISDQDLSRMVTLTSVPQPMDAIPIQVNLASYGIHSELEDELTLSTNPLLSNAIGGARILVRESDAARASEILAQTQRGNRKQPELAGTCPLCGSTKST